MWRLLKAELTDYQYIFIFAYGALIPVFAITSALEPWLLSIPRGGPALDFTMHLAKAIAVVGLGHLTQRTPHRKDRFLLRLSLPPNQIAAVRLARGLIFLAGFGLVFWLNLIAFGFSSAPSFKVSLWIVSILLSCNASLLIALDLPHYWKSVSRPSEWKSVDWPDLIYAAFILFHGASLWMRRPYFTAFSFPAGEYVLFLLCLIPSFLSIHIFSHRKSYLS